MEWLLPFSVVAALLGGGAGAVAWYRNSQAAGAGGGNAGGDGSGYVVTANELPASNPIAQAAIRNSAGVPTDVAKQILASINASEHPVVDPTGTGGLPTTPTLPSSPVLSSPITFVPFPTSGTPSAAPTTPSNSTGNILANAIAKKAAGVSTPVHFSPGVI